MDGLYIEAGEGLTGKESVVDYIAVYIVYDNN
jgi:hypothetical protein